MSNKNKSTCVGVRRCSNIPAHGLKVRANWPFSGCIAKTAPPGTPELVVVTLPLLVIIFLLFILLLTGIQNLHICFHFSDHCSASCRSCLWQSNIYFSLITGSSPLVFPCLSLTEEYIGLSVPQSFATLLCQIILHWIISSWKFLKRILDQLTLFSSVLFVCCLSLIPSQWLLCSSPAGVFSFVLLLQSKGNLPAAWPHITGEFACSDCFNYFKTPHYCISLFISSPL